ncbi:hypothetical protein C8Q77DRAFT_1109652, partial [Trametes polyzona]
MRTAARCLGELGRSEQQRRRPNATRRAAHPFTIGIAPSPTCRWLVPTAWTLPKRRRRRPSPSCPASPPDASAHAPLELGDTGSGRQRWRPDAMHCVADPLTVSTASSPTCRWLVPRTRTPPERLCRCRLLPRHRLLFGATSAGRSEILPWPKEYTHRSLGVKPYRRRPISCLRVEGPSVVPPETCPSLWLCVLWRTLHDVSCCCKVITPPRPLVDTPLTVPPMPGRNQKSRLCWPRSAKRGPSYRPNSGHMRALESELAPGTGLAV